MLLLLCLIPALGSDDFSVREAADRIIARQVGTRESYTLLSRVADTNLDPEIRVRCRRLAGPHLSDAVQDLCPWITYPPPAMTTWGTPPTHAEIQAERRANRSRLAQYVRVTGNWRWQDTVGGIWENRDCRGEEDTTVVVYDPTNWWSNFLEYGR